MNFNSAGGRRFIAVMACGLATTLLCAFGRIGEQWFVEAIKWTIVPFVLGNTVQHVAPYLPMLVGGKSGRDPV